MKRFREKRFIVLLAVSFLLLTCSCNRVNNSGDIQSSKYVDSLLLDAVNSSLQLDFDIALEKLQNVVEIAKSRKEYRNQILGINNLGNLYLYYNADEEALNYFYLALDLAKQHNIEELLNTIYNNIGIIHSSNRNFKKAEEYFLKALALSKERKEEKRIAINCINLGIGKNEQEDPDQASKYFQQSLEIFQELNDTSNIAAVLNNMGNTHLHKKHYSIAKKYYQQALQLSYGKSSNYFLPTYQLNYGKTLFYFGEYDSAMVYINTALDSFIVVKNTDKIIESLSWMANASKEKGEKEKAIVFYTESLMWKDTLLNEKSKGWVSEMQMKYEFGKKEKEIEFLQQKARQEKMIWGATIIAVFVFGIMLFYYLRVKNTNLKQQNIILEKEQELANLEIAKNLLQQEQLQHQLEMKNRELATKALHLVNKNEILNSVTNQLDQINVQDDPINAGLVRNAKNTIAHNINLDEQWEDFKIHFEEVHSDFFNRLIKDFPELSQTDLRLSAYFLINLNAKEIAQISNISPDSVRKRKQRLREKLNLNANQDIREILTLYERA